MNIKRTILISGASRGIGNSIAKKALKDGHNISLGIRKPEVLNGTILDPKISGEKNILISKYDAIDKNSALNWIENSKKHFNKFDTIIHCAGIFHRTGFLFNDQEEQEIENLWRTNLMGPWILSKLAWDQLEQNGNGRIIVLASMSGKRSRSNLAGYSVSKFALMGLCQTMRNQGWDKGIRITALCPGWVNTDMAEEVISIDKSLMTQTQDIAALVSSLLTLPNNCIPFEIKINCCLEKI
tara:strand:- start:1818 stop:2537 length:720 start_codon:yes stop_codon:yes gene_type:complete